MRHLLFVLMTMTMTMGTAFAQPAAAPSDFPSRQVRFVVPYPPGGAMDTVARLLSQKMGESLGQPVVVDNKPGATGMIAGEFVARAAPDGYTIMIDTSSLAVNPSLHAGMKFDVSKDLAPVTLAANMLNVLIVNPAVPARTVGELVALAKAQPGKLNYSSTGSGGPQHILAEQFKRAAGIDIVHVPYKGGAPAMQAVLANDAQLIFVSISTALPHLKSGKLRALATVGPARSKLLPEVPAITEAGYKGLVTSWLGILAPARTPAPVVKRLNAELVAALNDPHVRDRLEQQAFEVVASTPDAFGKFLDEELQLYGKLIREAGIRVD